MKKFYLLMISVLFMFALVACGDDDKDPNNNNNNDDPKVDIALDNSFKSLAKNKKVYLTTVGLSDLAIVQNILESATSLQAGTGFTVEALLTAGNVENGSIVFMVTGTSGKGLGEAGTNVEKEKERGEAFGDKAVAGDITLVVLHVGGEARRGTQTDPILRAVCPSANLMLVVNAGNADGLFTTLSTENQVPLYLFSKATKMVPAFQTLFE